MSSTQRRKEMRVILLSLTILFFISCKNRSNENSSQVRSYGEGFTVECDGLYAKQEEPGGGTWAIYIKKTGAGENAQDLIFSNAEKAAYEAAQENVNGNRDFYWMSPELSKDPSEYLFYMLTSYGYDIKSYSDYVSGRKMVSNGSGSIFRALGQSVDNGSGFRFVLERKFGQYSSSSGGRHSCLEATDQVDCRVQEYVFHNCHM